MNALLAGILVVALTAPVPNGPSEGDIAFQTGDFDAAFVAYNAALTASVNDADANLGIGTIDLYRNDLKNAKTYLSRAAQLDPGNSRAAARLQNVAHRQPSDVDFVIKMRGPVVVPFVATDPLPLVRAKVDGHSLLLLIDTGGTTIDLSPDTASRMGLATQDAGQRVLAGGTTGRVMSARIGEIAFEGLSVQGVPAAVLPDPLNVGGRHVDGLIGTAFLYRFLSTIDYANGRLVLRPKSASEQFETDSTKSGASIVPMWLIGDHFVFARARVNDSAPALFNVDTGGAGLGVQLTRAQLDALAITPDAAHPQQFSGAGGAAQMLPFTAQTVALGTYVQQNVPGAFFDEGNQYKIFPFTVAGTLSHEFFRSTQLSFDFDAMKLIVAHVEMHASTKPHGYETRRKNSLP